MSVKLLITLIDAQPYHFCNSVKKKKILATHFGRVTYSTYAP